MLTCFNTVSAAFMSDDEKQVRDFLDKARELGYLIESGVNYVKYKDKYQDLYVSFRRYEDKYKPVSPYYEDVKKIKEIYEDIADVWRGNAPHTVTYEEYYSQCIRKYPNFKSRLRRSNLFGSTVNEVIIAIHSYQGEYIKALETKLNKPPLQIDSYGNLIK